MHTGQTEEQLAGAALLSKCPRRWPGSGFSLVETLLALALALVGTGVYVGLTQYQAKTQCPWMKANAHE